MSAESEASLGKRIPRPSAKIISVDNHGEMQLSSHLAARNSAITVGEATGSHQLTAAASSSSTTSTSTTTSAPPPTTLPTSTPPTPAAGNTTSTHNDAIQPPSDSASAIEVISSGEDLDADGGNAPKKGNSSYKRVIESTDEDASAAATKSAKPQKKKHKATKKGSNKMGDISDESTEDDETAQARQALKNKTRDCDAFFGPTIRIAGNSKPMRECKLCSRNGRSKRLVYDISTLRRHVEAHHEAKYNEWCRANNFESKLPRAVKERHDAVRAALQQSQTILDPHLTERTNQPTVIPYTDERFKEAAIAWLIATDQPIQALEHKRFKEMIDIASHAPKGHSVVIPSRKVTRQHIMKLFDSNIKSLREHLQSNSTGLISMTCDAWQASNADAYFAVTGHWNEKGPDGIQRSHNALLGFVQMNSTHDGKTMGKALYRIVKRLGFGHKVGWITCDNASNNTTMLHHFARRLNRSLMRQTCKKQWDWMEYHIRCLAHVINLSTQAVLTTYSVAKHYDPEDISTHDPDIEGIVRDEVGLVRGITIKARSSAKRKERLLGLQREGGQDPLMLLIDMKVRWSSTLIMLQRGVKLKQFIKDFIYYTAKEEPDLAKRAKIDGLWLTEEEWARVDVLIELLSFADAAQQAFSYDNEPTLHHAIPALEALHTAWTTRIHRGRYLNFSDALQAGIDKIEDYYDKTASTHAYTFVMLLDPEKRMSHFKRHWSNALQKEVLDSAESIFKDRYLELYGETGRPKPVKKKQSKLDRLMAEYKSDAEISDDNSSTQSPSAATTTEPWLVEFEEYINAPSSAFVLDSKETLVQWWGKDSTCERFPVWASLARDYLAIRGSSISSERAFSSAGITISKRRNRLKADIVKALQFLKCMFRTELLQRDNLPCSTLEAELDIVGDDGNKDWVDEEDPTSWDSLAIDLVGSDDE